MEIGKADASVAARVDADLDAAGSEWWWCSERSTLG